LKLLDTLDEELIFLNKKFDDNKCFFKFVEEKASELGYVNTDYAEALNKRELEYPTGLQLKNKGVAIPHTDSKYIKKEFIALTTFETPLDFKSMEDADKTVEVNFSFVLGIKDSTKQLEILQKIIKIIQDDNFINTIIQAENRTEIVNSLKLNVESKY